MDNLVDIFSLVFQHITDIKDIYNILLTCKTFNNLIKSEIICIEWDDSKISSINLRTFPRLKRLKFIICIKDQEELDYISQRKFLQLHAYIDRKLDIKNFILNNSQLDTYSFIVGEFSNGKFHNTDHNNLYLLNGVYSAYNLDSLDLNNVNIHTIELYENYGHRKIFDKLDPKRYKIKMSLEELLTTKTNKFPITIPFKIEIGLCPNLRSKEERIYIRYNFYLKYIDPLEIFKKCITQLLYRFPNSNFDNIVYNRTGYKKYLMRELDKSKADLKISQLNKFVDRDYYDDYINYLRTYNNFIKLCKELDKQLDKEIIIDDNVRGVPVKGKFKVI